MGYLYMVIAKVFAGARGFSMKRAGAIAEGEKNSMIINLLRSLVCLAVSIGVWLFSGISGTTLFGNALVLISGVAHVLNLYFWILSASVISISLIEVFTMLGTVVLPLLLAPLLYGTDSVSPIQWIGVLFIFISVLFMSSEAKSFDRANGKKAALRASLYVIGAAGVALSQKLYTFHIADKGLGTVAYLNFGTFLIASVIFMGMYTVSELIAKSRAKKDGSAPYAAAIRAFPIKGVWIYIAIASVALYAYQYLLTLASSLPSAVFFPLSYGLGIIVGLILDTFVFSVKLTKSRIAGFAAVGIAIILVNL